MRKVSLFIAMSLYAGVSVEEQGNTVLNTFKKIADEIALGYADGSIAIDVSSQTISEKGVRGMESKEKAVLGIHLSSLPILTKNLYTFCCSAPLVPLAFLISKFIGVDFQNKGNR